MPWKYILVALKYISVPLKKFYPLRCGRILTKEVTLAKDKYVRFDWAAKRMRAKGYDDALIAELLDLDMNYVKGS